jgi:hypothetical protein
MVEGCEWKEFRWTPWCSICVSFSPASLGPLPQRTSLFLLCREILPGFTFSSAYFTFNSLHLHQWPLCLFSFLFSCPWCPLLFSSLLYYIFCYFLHAILMHFEKEIEIGIIYSNVFLCQSGNTKSYIFSRKNMSQHTFNGMIPRSFLYCVYVIGHCQIVS